MLLISHSRLKGRGMLIPIEGLALISHEQVDATNEPTTPASVILSGASGK